MMLDVGFPLRKYYMLCIYYYYGGGEMVRVLGGKTCPLMIRSKPYKPRCYYYLTAETITAK